MKLVASVRQTTLIPAKQLCLLNLRAILADHNAGSLSSLPRKAIWGSEVELWLAAETHDGTQVQLGGFSAVHPSQVRALVVGYIISTSDEAAVPIRVDLSQFTTPSGAIAAFGRALEEAEKQAKVFWDESMYALNFTGDPEDYWDSQTAPLNTPSRSAVLL